MKHPCIEFIIACSCCQIYNEFVKELAKDYPNVEIKIYVAGEDFDYIPKYGAVSSTILVINEKEKITDISKTTIRSGCNLLKVSAKEIEHTPIDLAILTSSLLDKSIGTFSEIG